MLFVFTPCLASLFMSVSKSFVVSSAGIYAAEGSLSTKMSLLSISQAPLLMYWFQWEDVLGYLPVWSVNTFMAKSSFVAKTCPWCHAVCIWILTLGLHPPTQPVATAGLAMDCRVGLRWYFRCGCPNSKQRSVLDSSSKNQGSFFVFSKSQKMSSYGQKRCLWWF